MRLAPAPPASSSSPTHPSSLPSPPPPPHSQQPPAVATSPSRGRSPHLTAARPSSDTRHTATRPFPPPLPPPPPLPRLHRPREPHVLLHSKTHQCCGRQPRLQRSLSHASLFCDN